MPHRLSMRFKSGLWAGHWRTFILLDSNQDLTTRGQCFGSLSCWNVHASGKLSAKSPFRWSFKMFLYFSPVIFPLIWTIEPTPDEVKHPQTTTDEPPCLTVFFVYFLSNSFSGGRRTYGLPSFPKTLNLDSSLQTIIFQNCESLRQCSWANCNLFLIFFFWHVWFSSRNSAIQVQTPSNGLCRYLNTVVGLHFGSDFGWGEKWIWFADPDQSSILSFRGLSWFFPR